MAGMCRKDCGNCESRQRNGCRGCLETEGVPVWGACRAAACCRSRGYPDCSGCDARTSCGKPEEAEEARRQWTAEEGECRNRNRMRFNKKERTHKASALFMYDIRGNQSWHRPAVMMAME